MAFFDCAGFVFFFSRYILELSNSFVWRFHVVFSFLDSDCNVLLRTVEENVQSQRIRNMNSNVRNVKAELMTSWANLDSMQFA